MADSRRNLVLFMPDQLRADAVGAFGNPVAHTPAMDALAARGTTFTNAFSQHSVCSPSRASMLTGWYPHVTGKRTLTNLIKPWEPNLLRYLHDDGYHVAWVGQRGDTFAPGVTEVSCDFYGWTVRPTMLHHPIPYPPEHHLARAFYAGRRPADGPVLDFDEAAVITAEEIVADLPEPWVLFVALVFPHPPFEVEDPWFSLHDRPSMPLPAAPPEGPEPRFMTEIRRRYGTERVTPGEWQEIIATYYGMVSRVDDQLRRVTEAVDRAGSADRTVTMLFTDHGEYLGDYGLVEKFPSGVHDCLLRNPLIIAGPGVREGAVCDDLVELVDLLPTCLELAGVEPTHTHFGRSLVPALSGSAGAADEVGRDAAYAEGGFTPAERHLMESGVGFPYDLKIAIQHEDEAAAGKCVAMRTREWTYVHRLYDTDELYDRAADPRETSNLVDRPDLAPVVADLRSRLLDWLVETSDVIPWEPDPRNPRVARPPLAVRSR
ncbi:MAG TPA: sulfatase-like hydrolase/transferase [Acidimicrobiales bacterium]|nr:sulfatase-like hydrolase/transferase [Acidimicrobiales bacterium]